MTKNELMELGRKTRDAKKAVADARMQKSVAFAIERINEKTDEMTDYILRNVADVMSNGHSHLKFLVSNLRDLDEAENEVNDDRSLYHYVRIVEREHKHDSLTEIVQKMISKRSAFVKAGGRLNRLGDYDLKRYFHWIAGVAQVMAIRKLRRDGFSIKKVYWSPSDDEPTEYDIHWDNVADDYSFPV